MTRRCALTVLAAMAAPLATADRGEAQPLGTFRWQLQPFCNVVTVNVVQQGAVYTLDGFDDQCGAPQRAPLVGLATPNPDGTIGLGFNVTVSGAAVQIGARITLAALGGPWTDSAGNSGTFAFGASTGGSPRPPVTGGSVIPAPFALLNDGGFLARGTVNVGAIPSSGAGTRMMWHPGTSAFRVGTVLGAQWDVANVGLYSTAFGYNTTASGVASSAFGNGTTASGEYSTAMGVGTTASGHRSTAMGDRTVASGRASTAMGQLTTASGIVSTAMGFSSTASGTYSIAMGDSATASGNYSTAIGESTAASGPFSTAMGLSSTASGHGSTAMGLATTASGINSTAMGSGSIASGDVAIAAGLGPIAAGFASVALGRAHARFQGSFVWGDQSTPTLQTDAEPNQFVVRATRGVGFYTNAANTLGVELPISGGGWTILSDRNAKEAFRDLDQDEVLAKIARLPLQEWQYKDQPGAVRHIGPVAQDFHEAFGLGESPLRINMIDADGVALAAIKALEARTRASQAWVMRENEALRRENDDLRARLARLEALLDKR